MRARLEPVVEMMQIKGESECRNGMYGVLGEPDELCGFEKVRDLGQQVFEDCEEGAGHGAQAGRGCSSRTDFVRYALLEGLREKERIGVNPYAFGFIGSTDNHMSVPGAVSEASAPYKFGTPLEKLLSLGEAKRAPAFWNPGGLAAVWAEENTRDSIFDALKRREAFATSGPRIVPRGFGGWEMDPGLCDSPNFAQEGYASGVPMGGQLPPRPADVQGPIFAVSALADPGLSHQPGGLLQRIQVIKGWAEGDATFERVYDVACSGGADVDPETHRCPDNGASVDLETCAVLGNGSSQLRTVWSDPDFDADERAFYYARVLENPTCRWSTWDALRAGVPPRSDLAATIQERAWSSPIQYRPVQTPPGNRL